MTYSQISIENAPKIGEGAHGEVYRIAEDTIVKVYRPTVSPEAAVFLGIDVDTATRLWERTLQHYLGDAFENDAKETTKMAQILGCIRIIDFADRRPEQPDRDLILKTCTDDILNHL